MLVASGVVLLIIAPRSGPARLDVLSPARGRRGHVCCLGLHRHAGLSPGGGGTPLHMSRPSTPAARSTLVVLCIVLCVVPAALASTYNLVGAPHASFTWTPQLPQVGEPITLRSTSTERGGRIARYAWDFHDNGPFGAFEEGAAVASASFATPAPHVIRLRVTDQNGASDIAAATVQMTPPPASAGLMYPFPIVRIRGRPFPLRVKIDQLWVKAPAGALITASCAQRRCPVHFVRRTSSSVADRLKWTPLHRFARSFPAGVALEVRVSAKGEVGAYTRFVIRRGRLPTRTDSCLDTSGVRPIRCPAS
jgi:PKD domain